MKYSLDRFALHLFLASAALFFFAYGFLAGKYRTFPHAFINDAIKGFQELRNEKNDALPWYFKQTKHPSRKTLRNSQQAYEGLNLIVQISAGEVLTAKITDMSGKELHSWTIDWFEIWPDAAHLPERRRPKSPPGTHIHGAVVMENGDLIFNFESLGIVRIDLQGKVMWRLPYQTHHSIHRHDDGNLWVCGQKDHDTESPRFPNRLPPFDEYTILEVTPEGEIVQEWSVPELLRKNGWDGLLYLGSLANDTTLVRGDVLHLNDVEPFPTTLEPGFFKQGDVMVSLRNINTIFVFNRESEKISFICTGKFVRQHDPDFLDAETISIFDNNNIAPEDGDAQSRIVTLSAPDKNVEVYFEGNEETPFFTNIMGKHQWLPNGNLLITESTQGRAFELNPDGEIVWQYVNYVDDGVVGLVEEVQRLPLEYTHIFEASESKESKSNRSVRKQKVSAPTD